MNTTSIRTCNSRRTADIVLRFNRPAQEFLYRAYDHLVAARHGMTLMVPVNATAGRLVPIRDLCPVPWLEATEILAADYTTAAPLSLVSLVTGAGSIHRTSPHALFAQVVVETFVGSDTEAAVALTDTDWRHTRIQMAQGGASSRVFIGAAGVRLAFTPDFLEGIL